MVRTQLTREHRIKRCRPHFRFSRDASALKGKGPFDVIIANINRNILLNDMKQYVSCMHPGSELYMSGFYVDDIPVIQAEAERNGLHFVHHKEKNRWAAVKFVS